MFLADQSAISGYWPFEYAINLSHNVSHLLRIATLVGQTLAIHHPSSNRHVDLKLIHPSLIGFLTRFLVARLQALTHDPV